MQSSSKRLLEKINKLRGCLCATTADLAPYPVTTIPNKRRKWKVVEQGQNCFSICSDDGHQIKTTFKTRKQAQQVCDEHNGLQ